MHRVFYRHESHAMTKTQHPEFHLDSQIIHLNHAAVAPWPQRTVNAVANFARENGAVGSTNYLHWLTIEKTLKKQLKQLINAPSINDIALVKNTSEALSFVAYGLNWNSGDNIVSSNIEFPSNRIPWQSLKNQGVEFRQTDLQQDKTPEASLFSNVDKNTRLITISSVQFAAGQHLDLEMIGDFCQQHGILFCIDAIQSLGAIKFDVQRYQADFVMADGHKWMGGPGGLGVFYSRPDSRKRLKLTQFGWHMIKDTHDYENQPWEAHSTAQRFECGSPNMLGIHALSASLSVLLEVGMDTVEQQLLANARYLASEIQQHKQLLLLSASPTQLNSGIVLFKPKTLTKQRLFNYLQNKQVLCAMRGDGIRFSPHFYNTLDQLKHALTLVDEATTL